MPQKPPDLDQFGNPVSTGAVGAKPPDLDQYGLPMYPEAQPTALGQAWKWASSPLTTVPAEIGKDISNYITTPSLATSPTGEGGLRDFLATNYARMKGFSGGAWKGLGNVASELSSPINLALAGLTGGASLAEKTGLGQIAALAKTGARAASIPFAAEGAQKVFSPESTLGERGMGFAEMAGGLAGIKYPMGPSGKRITITSPEDIDIALKAGRINARQATQLIEKYHADKAAFEATTQAGPTVEPTIPTPEPSPQLRLPFEAEPVQAELPFKQPINPAVAGPIATGKGATFEDILGPGPFEATTGPEGIQAAFKGGKITQTQAVRLLEKYYTEEAAKIKVKPTEVKPTEPVVEAAAKPVPPVAEVPPVEAKPIPTIPETPVEIPPVAPLTQLPTQPGLAQVIKAIPRETGNIELDGMVGALRAMRRRKGIDEFNGLETNAYKMLMDKIKNHPSLPPELKARWDTLEAGKATTTPIEVPPHAGKELTYIIPRENATANFINKARSDGYEFAGLTDRGDYRFRKAAPEPSLTTRLAGEKGALEIGGKPEIGTPAKVLEGGTVVVKSGKVNPQTVKRLFGEGFRFVGENEVGDLQFRKIAPGGAAPVLEQEVGLHRPTRRAAQGQLGQLQDVQKSNIVLEAFNLPRGILASWDFSAPLRQGLPLIHKKEFWTAMKPMFESWASEEGFRASQENIASRPLFRKRVDAVGKELPSFADDAGLKLTDLTDLSKREEAIMSTWAEKVPLVRASNRAYTSFLNNLRADVFESLIRDGKVLADVNKNLPLARSLADFVNTATGRGSLGKFESSATILNTGLFAPRLIASRVKMLNPAYYIMAPPMVRREALKSLFAVAAVGNTVLQLAKMAGAEVGTDPNSSDFGKAVIGNVRIDPWGGFQQYIVAANRLIRPGFAKIPGFEGGAQTGIAPVDLATSFLGGGGQRVTSSTSGREYDLWNPQGPYAPSHLTIAGRLLRGKLNPVMGFAYSILDAQKEMTGQRMDFTNPNPMNNAIAQRFIPILIQDLYQLSQENPELLPILGPAAALGMGIQTYNQPQ